MGQRIKAVVLLCLALCAIPALGQQRAIVAGEASPGVYNNVPVNASNYLLVDCPACTGSASPTGLNNADNVVSVGTGLGGSQSFNYAYDGTNWDRVRLDGSAGNLLVNCVVGCSGGTTTPSDAFANPTTAGITFSFLAGFNGSTWDRLQVDGSKFLKTVISAALPAGTNVIGHVITDTGSTTAVTGNVAITAAALPLPSGASTSAKQPALGTAGTASADVITVQGIASMTKLLVTPDSVALPANQSVNVSQINAVTPLMGNGITGTGSQRVTIASDNTAFSVNAAATQSGTWTVQPGNTANTTAWKVDGSAVTQPVSGSVTATQATGTNLHTVIDSGTVTTVSTVTNLSQLGGTAISMNTGTRDAGTQRVTIATNDIVPASQSGTWTNTVTQGTASNLNAAVVGTGTAGSAAGGVLTIQGVASMTPILTTPAANSAVNVAQIGGTTVVADPCDAVAKTNFAISQATSTQIITGTSAKKTYICSIMLITGAAENVALTAGTGTVCATGASAIIGSTTVANGLILAANGGFTHGNGRGTVANGTVNADNVCLLQSGSVRVSGVLQYVQQ